jgi:hypothetical protein
MLGLYTLVGAGVARGPGLFNFFGWGFSTKIPLFKALLFSEF